LFVSHYFYRRPKYNYIINISIVRGIFESVRPVEAIALIFSGKEPGLLTSYFWFCQELSLHNIYPPLNENNLTDFA